jgi:hypothetical protein
MFFPYKMKMHVVERGGGGGGGGGGQSKRGSMLFGWIAIATVLPQSKKKENYYSH